MRRPGSTSDAPDRDSPAEGVGPGSAWADLPDRLRARGLRWTPQRRVLVDVLLRTNGHVSGAELVERCRETDPGTIPSTVYRTLDVLEELGILSHSHGADGREEFHVLPRTEHGHLFCAGCGASWDVEPAEIAALATALQRQQGFELDLSHLAIVGRCADCRRLETPATV